MNFLAHLYLSGENDGMKLGNFIGDFVKGKKYLNYAVVVQKGILLHRQIDYFTDLHPIVKESASLFKSGYGRYSGIVVDLFFDHFLALNWDEYSIYKLKDYTRNIYKLLLSNFWILPLEVKEFLPFLIKNRRLESYSLEYGIKKALEIMSHYTSLPEKTDFALDVFHQNKKVLAKNFIMFMKEIIGFVESNNDVEIKKPSGHPL
jgi:acyl carrier protein phosphodiesterase